MGRLIIRSATLLLAALTSVVTSRFEHSDWCVIVEWMRAHRCIE